MKVIDLLSDEYCIIEHKGVTYIGKGQFWFDSTTYKDVRYTGVIKDMELERQRVLAVQSMAILVGEGK